MTEPRIDLRAAYPANPRHADRVIAAAMSRVEATSRVPAARATVLGVLGDAWWRRASAAAILVASVAVGVRLLVARRTEPHCAAGVPAAQACAEVVIAWVAGAHAPTGDELLTLFQGYRP